MYQDSTDIGVDLFQFLYRRAFVLNIDESLANVFYSGNSNCNVIRNNTFSFQFSF